MLSGLQARQGHHEGRGRTQGPPGAPDPQVRTDAWRPVLQSARLRKDSRLEMALLCWHDRRHRPRDGPCAASGPEGDCSLSQPLGPAWGPSSRDGKLLRAREHRNRKRGGGPDRSQFRNAPKPRSWFLPPIPPEFSRSDLTGWGLFLIRG